MYSVASTQAKNNPVYSEVIAAAEVRAAELDVPVQWGTMRSWSPRKISGLNISCQGEAIFSDTAEFIERGHYVVNPESVLSIGDRSVLKRSSIEIIGKRCGIFIGPMCRISEVKIRLEHDDCIVVIGKRTTWESGSLICDRGRMVVLGEDCMFSNAVLLRTSDGHGIFSPRGELLNPPADIIISPHVWLGNGVRINKGTKIPTGSIIGQGSVVSGALKKPHYIYGGTPAKPIRGPVNWGRRYEFDSVPERFRCLNEAFDDETNPGVSGRIIDATRRWLSKITTT
ncbi:acyltransferase [Agrobacterium pusense]|uniref:acyltransferase n=1 Tax=Agrobacterium pusense TaxID=648995 RepID=UPI001300A4B1|nr:hypothetical protein [Agrobacterium pusense]